MVLIQIPFSVTLECMHCIDLNNNSKSESQGQYHNNTEKVTNYLDERKYEEFHVQRQTVLTICKTCCVQLEIKCCLYSFQWGIHNLDVKCKSWR